MKNILLILFLFVNSSLVAQDINKQLLEAAYDNNDKKINELLTLGADVNATTSDGVSPLMYAVQNGNYYLCQKLIRKGALVNKKPKIGIYPIVNAIFNSDTAIFLLLLENKANPNTIFEEVNYDEYEAYYTGQKNSILELSILEKKYFFAEALLHYGADPNILFSGTTPIIAAIETKADTSFLQLLLNYGADPNKIVANYSPLTVSVLENNKKITDLLLKNNAKIITKPDKSFYSKKTVLDVAILNKYDYYFDKFLPYFNENLDYFHTKALVNNRADYAKKIRTDKNKLFLKPVISHIVVSPVLLFNLKDIFGGLSFGIVEIRYNFDLKFSVVSRFIRKQVLLKQRENVYLRALEKRILISIELDKYFTLVHFQKSGFGIMTGANFIYSNGNYKGLNAKITNKYLFSPTVGLFSKHRFFRTGINYSYIPFSEQFPHYLSIKFDFLIPLHVSF